MHDKLRERPRWYYSHLSQATREALVAKAPALLDCRCGGVVTVAKMSASGADDGPAYLYCEACYRSELKDDRDRHIPIAVDAISIDFSDIVWSPS